MPELGSLGTVRGALGNERPYREHSRSAAHDPKPSLTWRVAARNGAVFAGSRLSRISPRQPNAGKRRPRCSPLVSHLRGLAVRRSGSSPPTRGLEKRTRKIRLRRFSTRRLLADRYRYEDLNLSHPRDTPATSSVSRRSNA